MRFGMFSIVLSRAEGYGRYTFLAIYVHLTGCKISEKDEHFAIGSFLSLEFQGCLEIRWEIVEIPLA